MSMKKLMYTYLAMIALALLVLAAPSMAYAQSSDEPELIGTIVNKAGGKILLFSHDEHPPCKGDLNGRAVLSYAKDGKTALGCWHAVPAAQLVKIKWDDGDTTVYPYAAVAIDETYAKWNEAQEQSTSNSGMSL